MHTGELLSHDLAVIEGQPPTPLTVLTGDEENNVLRPDVGGGDEIAAFQTEIEEMARSIQSGQPSAIIGGDLARDAIILCQKQAESVKTGRPVSIT